MSGTRCVYDQGRTDCGLYRSLGLYHARRAKQAHDADGEKEQFELAGNFYLQAADGYASDDEHHACTFRPNLPPADPRFTHKDH